MEGKTANRKATQSSLTASGKWNRRKKAETETECVVDGRRIVDLKVMSQHMRCNFCKENLLLRNIKNRREIWSVASVFSVLCQNCLLMNKVLTGTKHPGPKKSLYDVNTKSALDKFVHYNSFYIIA